MSKDMTPAIRQEFDELGSFEGFLDAVQANWIFNIRQDAALMQKLSALWSDYEKRVEIYDLQ